MTDEQLASQLVEMGIGVREIANQGRYGIPTRGLPEYVDADLFVRDPRVAIAVMEKMSRHDLIISFVGSTRNPKWHLLDKLRDPRAICEAGCEALGG